MATVRKFLFDSYFIRGFVTAARTSYFFAVVSCMGNSEALAAPPDPTFPPCLGYDQEKMVWGIKDVELENPSNCPKGHAMLALRDTIRSARPDTYRELSGFCCPLPAGALTEEHTYSPLQCPENAVVTGSRKTEQGALFLRCSKIDTARFQLASTLPAQRLAASQEYLPRMRDSLLTATVPPRLSWSAIPPALRYGIGRISQTSWITDVCLGRPIGSILTAVNGRSCEEYGFQELKLQGTTQHSIPLPECRAIDNPLSKDASCMP